MSTPPHLKAWMEKLDAYQDKHPNLSRKECMIKLGKKNKKKRVKGGNPLIAAAVGAVPEALNSVTKGIETGVKAQHEFNKDNGALAAEKAKNFTKFFRDLQHTRYWDPESIKPSLRLKKFGIDPPNSQNDKKNEAKLERANDALYDWAEKEFDKQMGSIKR